MQLRIQILLAYFSSLVLYVVLDGVWLGLIAKDFYAEHLGALFTALPNWPVVIVFYLLFGIGLTVFAIAPALKRKEVGYAAAYGALFGFFTYMTYDLTNWATIGGWSAAVTYADVAWGTFASCIVATASYMLVRKLVRG